LFHCAAAIAFSGAVLGVPGREGDWDKAEKLATKITAMTARGDKLRFLIYSENQNLLFQAAK
jgi:hypothetical protein